MTNEEKQDIAAECRRLIAEASKEGAGYRTVAKGKVAEFALAALTAQPIELPQRYSCEGYHIDEAYLVADEDGDCFDRDEVIEKLRQQGYEVQE